MRFDNAMVTALCIGLLPAAMAGSVWANDSPEDRPNIVLIMADDMGFSDLGSYGGEINTPNLDALAENGLRYRTFYNQARCMPTRAVLLTGRYPHQTGLGEMGGDRGEEHPGYRGNINHESVTLAEVLRVNVDQGIAQIVEALQETRRFENTLILFLSDNGAAAEWGIYGIGWPRLGNNGAPIGQPQSYASIGVAWAHVSNAPFRLWKTFNHEGGTATPFIVHWPAGIDARGEWRDFTGHIIDVMPTLLEVSGAVYPTQYGGHQIQPYEGVSLVPSFTDDSLAREGPLFFEHLGRRAVRDGKWKLVTRETGQDGRWELYDMEADRVESTDIVTQHPERAKAMANQWQEWAERANVLPMLPDQ